MRPPDMVRNGLAIHDWQEAGDYWQVGAFPQNCIDFRSRHPLFYAIKVGLRHAGPIVRHHERDHKPCACERHERSGYEKEAHFGHGGLRSCLASTIVVEMNE